MIEFTISRVVLCACGVLLMVVVTSALGGVYDKNTDVMDEDLASRFAYMLDIFQSSDDDTIVLDGARILPEGYTAMVHDGFVELLHDDRRNMAATDYTGEFKLRWGDTITVTHRTSPRSS